MSLLHGLVSATNLSLLFCLSKIEKRENKVVQLATPPDTSLQSGVHFRLLALPAASSQCPDQPALIIAQLLKPQMPEEVRRRFVFGVDNHSVGHHFGAGGTQQGIGNQRAA